MTETLTLRPASDPAPGRRASSLRPGRPYPRIVLAASALLVLVGAHLTLAAFMRVPIIQPDELGYLQNARFLARGGPRSETEYYPGFSLLLVPLWWISTDPTFAFRGALAIEAVVAALGAVLCWRLTAALAPTLAGWRRALVVLLAVGTPAAVLYGNFALAEVTFAVVFTGVVLLAAKAFSTAAPGWWLALGVSSGALALVHPRGFAVVVAVGLFALLVLGLRRRTLPALFAVTVGVASSGAATRWLVTVTKGPVAPDFGSYRPDSVLSKSLSLHGGLSLFSELAGQLWYLSLTTFGLVPLGLLLGGRSLARVLRGDRTPWVLTQGFATLSFVGVWALSSLFMNLGDRADKLIYGRYNEGVIIPLLVIALADLLRARPDRHFRATHDRAAARRWLTASVATIVGCGAIVQLGHSSAQLHGPLNPANVLGLAPLLNRMGGHIHVVTMSAIVLAAVVVLAAVAWRLPVVSVLCVAAAFAWVAVDLQTTYLVPGTRARANQDDISMALSALEHVPGVDLSCVAWERDKAVDYNYYNDRFLVPALRFLQFDPTKGTGPCGTLVVSTAGDFATRFPGARIVTSEDFVAQTLWAIPRPSDPTFSVLDGDGWLSPPTPTLGAAVAIPTADLKGSQIDVKDVDDLSLASGRSVPLTIAVRHGAGGAPWPSVAALHSGSGQFAVQVAVSWSGIDGPTGTYNLPETLLPGQRATFAIPLSATDAAGTPIAPGTYTVHLGLLQQEVGSFSDPGTSVTVRVTR